jgi:hypothetical protein
MNIDSDIIIQFLVSGFGLIAVCWGRLVSYPDNVQRFHGIPLTWGIHQLITIIGPVDIWTIRVSSLFFDLLLWFILVILSPLIYARVVGRGSVEKDA